MKLKFMSFNLRVNMESDGVNSFFNRTDRIFEMLDKEHPDVIGFQEVTDEMRTWLRNNLKGYTIQGCGRQKDYRGESTAVAYRTDTFELISLDNFALSTTPRVFGTTYGGDQSGCPRMATSLLLKHIDSPTPFRFVNTHLDHVGEVARYLGATQLIQMLSATSEQFVLTGDFNALPDTPEIKLFTQALASRGVVDCTEGMGGTFHGFGAYANKEDYMKIDYIFTDGVCERSYMVKDTPVNKVYYSDHMAVCAEIMLK